MPVLGELMLTFLACSIAGAGAVKSDKGVLVLSTSNFDDAIKKYKVVMVKFYAPWCGHCKALAPDWAKAARKLKKTTPLARLAKVDSDDSSNSALNSKYEVTGFPTLTVFVDGKTKGTYDGDRAVDAIVDHVLSLTPSATALDKAKVVARKHISRLKKNGKRLFKDVKKLINHDDPLTKYGTITALAFTAVSVIVMLIWACSPEPKETVQEKKAMDKEE